LTSPLTPPLNASVAFTDGSAKPNPGPCGGGYILRKLGSSVYTTTVIPLGYGDNNLGEMGAIRGLLAEALALVRSGELPRKSELLVFSDSALCCGYLNLGWAFGTWTLMGHDTRALYRELKRFLKVRLYWIRGHMGIEGNELADRAADAAAQESASRIDSSGDPATAGPLPPSPDSSNIFFTPEANKAALTDRQCPPRAGEGRAAPSGRRLSPKGLKPVAHRFARNSPQSAAGPGSHRPSEDHDHRPP
jgi:ribonuclease HI